MYEKWTGEHRNWIDGYGHYSQNHLYYDASCSECRVVLSRMPKNMFAYFHVGPSPCDVPPECVEIFSRLSANEPLGDNDG